MTHMHHLLRFLLEQSVLASRGALPLFTELPRRGLFGNSKNKEGPERIADLALRFST